MQAFFDLADLELDSIKNRLLKIIFYIGGTLLFFLCVLFIISYFLFALFTLDWIYYVITGKTVIWGELMDY